MKSGAGVVYGASLKTRPEPAVNRSRPGERAQVTAVVDSPVVSFGQKDTSSAQLLRAKRI